MRRTLVCCWSESTPLPPVMLTVPPTSPPRLPVCPAGSDQWKMSERKLFNKGIAIYKKDFFLVQKLVSWSSVSGESEGRNCVQDLGSPYSGGLQSLTKPPSEALNSMH